MDDLANLSTLLDVHAEGWDGRKPHFGVEDVTLEADGLTEAERKRREGLTQVAHAYCAVWEGDFEFMKDMTKRIESEWGLSPGQIKGILNCLSADIIRGRRDAA